MFDKTSAATDLLFEETSVEDASFFGGMYRGAMVDGK